ncbi:5-deoxy-glucuronate isomerase [Peribacillus psychrosaccharolyticus]|uniref:5-deoxy-glucuronate isomerase n=1 Tax=Peribacillus psychrosaccharolyticus TaxID=1407 RepID=A0A974NQ32_PERPY|nr:5-deoxy-glucuronate isomerase [Peribacillus psychrosaccharolyticus]MEC2057679.1 5-deoxy-glucuronate isomerase [Peribacillus psychrosaccharolyticus]MED3746369.1 5-deoxy-glucuronate isomerase [Peribacillus psychrosaccharolyticus]QQT01954.1 5-deoxy-glucuronate isomerase [Peribacillus psychrosaccharolyticus]
MSKLLQKSIKCEMSNGVTVVQEVAKENSLLKFIEFKVVKLNPHSKFSELLNDTECCIIALTGKINVTVVGEESFLNLGTRKSVFEKIPTDSIYISNNKFFEVEGITEARVALCYSPSNKQLPTKLIKAEDVGVEHRGILNNKRMVHNILPDSDSTANSLLVVEVYTESGNWSSYPPHKHDQDNLPDESLLEESYYHEMNPPQGFVFQRVYTDDRSIDETMTVENGDVVLVPAGYHPVGVPDGYESYYLNVMAGPKRIWKFNNDPNHEWILKR